MARHHFSVIQPNSGMQINRRGSMRMAMLCFAAKGFWILVIIQMLD
jgi:hypothetical protein